MPKEIKTFFNLYEIIFKDIKASNKYIKQHYSKISNNSSNIDDIKNLNNYLKNNVKQNIKSYLDFLQELKNIMIKKADGIYEKLEYLFKVTRAFDTPIQKGGSPKSNEIYNNLKKTYGEYENIFHNFKVFMYSTNIKVLKDHENKIENLINIYSFIDHLINHLQFISMSYYKMMEQLFYLETYNIVIKTKTEAYTAIRKSNKKNKEDVKHMLEKIKEETNKIDSLILSSQNDYPEQIKKEANKLTDMINKSLHKLQNKYKPTLIESLHEQIIELLNSRKYVAYITKNTDDRILDIITKYFDEGYKPTLSAELYEQIISLLNKDKEIDKEIKDKILELIKEAVVKLKNKRKSKTASKK